MSSIPATRDVFLDPADNVRLVELCGPLDAHLRLIEGRLSVEIKRRGNRFQIIGIPLAARQAETVLVDLYARAQREPVDSERVHMALQAIAMAWLASVITTLGRPRRIAASKGSTFVGPAATTTRVGMAAN